MADEPMCSIHKRKLICPSCEGAKGGKKTAKKHGAKLSDWGKQGGRPKTNDKNVTKVLKGTK